MTDRGECWVIGWLDGWTAGQGGQAGPRLVTNQSEVRVCCIAQGGWRVPCLNVEPSDLGCPHRSEQYTESPKCMPSYSCRLCCLSTWRPTYMLEISAQGR